jgi:sulfur-carrier protein
MPQLFLPASLRDLVNGSNVVELPGGTVRELLASLDILVPGVAQRLTVEGQLRPGWNVSIGGRLAREGLRAKVAPEDEVHFIPAVGGG